MRTPKASQAEMKNEEPPQTFLPDSNNRFWVFAAVTVGLVGIVLRSGYALWLHDPTDWVVSDAYYYVSQALTFALGQPPQTAGDAIWPPGTSALLSFSLLIGGDLRLAQFLFLFLSIATIWLTWLFARCFGSRRFAAFAAIPASLAIAPIHFTGLFLSEAPGTAAVFLALVLSARTLSLTRGAPALLHGLIAGLSWGLAASIRPQNLVVGTCVMALVGLLQWTRSGSRTALALGLSSVVGFSIWLAPLSYRCSTLTGRFCLVSGNSLFNSVIGFSGDVASVQFSDATWSPPAKLQHELTGSASIAASMFDTDGLLNALVEKIQKHPLDSFVAFLGNGLDLFRDFIWLIEDSPVPRRYYIVGQQLFLLLVITPAIASMMRISRPNYLSSSSHASLFLLMTFASVFFVHAISLGESRYRLPYDIILYALAAAFYTGEAPRLHDQRSIRGAPLILILFLGLLILLSGLTSSDSSTRTVLARLGAPLRGAPSHNQISIPCTKTLPVNNSRWNAPKHIVVGRDQVINVQFPMRITQHQLSASFDWNDIYRVIFKRGSVPVGETFIICTNHNGLGGMSQVIISVPPEGLAEGFDALSIHPIAGDGKASFGGVLCP